MIDKNNFMPLNYFKKTNYMGSITGLRFCLGKAVIPYTDEEIARRQAAGEEIQEGAGTTVLRAQIWEGPFSYEKADKEKLYFMDFPFTADGIGEAADWINNEYSTAKSKWDDIPFWTPEMSKNWEYPGT